MPRADRSFALSRTLADLGEILGPELSAKTRHRLRFDPTALAVIAELSARHQIRGKVWLALCRHGLCTPLPQIVRDRLPPGHPARVLEEGWRHESNHQQHLTARTGILVRALNAVGIEPMLLKGMALVMGGVLPQPGQRWMVDIDILVPPDQVSAAVATLASLGYRARSRHAAPHHVAAMAMAGSAGEVEVHFDMVPPALQGALPTDAVWERAIRVEEDGLRYALPAPGDAVLHIALHGQHGNHVEPLARIALRHLADLAQMRVRHDPHLDWPALRHRARLAGRSFAFDNHLYQCCRIFRQPWPFPAPVPVAVRLHWRLCLMAATHPRSIGRVLLLRLELASLFGPLAQGRDPLARMLARMALTARLLCKYKWKIVPRLMGKHR